MKIFELLMKWIYFYIPFIIATGIVFTGIGVILFVPLYFYFYEPKMLESFEVKEWIGFGAGWWTALGALVSYIAERWPKKHS